MLADAGNNYGPFFGVFVNDKEASTVKKFCYSGSNSMSMVSGKMEPDRNPAVTFDCL